MESPRPLLAIPHLLNQESAAPIAAPLALMAVEQNAPALPARATATPPTTRAWGRSAASLLGPNNGTTHDSLRSPHWRRLRCRSSGRGACKSVSVAQAWARPKPAHDGGEPAPVGLRERTPLDASRSG